MTYDKDLFKELRRTNTSRVWIENGEYLPVEGKGTVAILTCSGTKLISDVLYVPVIDYNLFSVGQLIEKGYKTLFKNKSCWLKMLMGWYFQNNYERVKLCSKSIRGGTYYFPNQRKYHWFLAQEVTSLPS